MSELSEKVTVSLGKVRMLGESYVVEERLEY